MLAIGVLTCALIRRWRQWRETVIGGFDVLEMNLLQRIEKLEEDLKSSATVVRVLSRQLGKLGIRFRVTRKSLKEPIAEACEVKSWLADDPSLTHVKSLKLEILAEGEADNEEDENEIPLGYVEIWKILYDGGDVEILPLERECWELIDKGRKSTKKRKLSSREIDNGKHSPSKTVNHGKKHASKSYFHLEDDNEISKMSNLKETTTSKAGEMNTGNSS